MKFSQRYSIRKNLDTGEIARGIWNPTRSDYRDLVEDYLYISRKRMGNKLSMFKLQLHILMEIVEHTDNIAAVKKRIRQLKNDSKEGKISKEDCERDTKSLKTDIFMLQMTERAFREIMDGVVWRYFGFNRGFLYTIANKEPVEAVRMDEGMISSIYEFMEMFLEPHTFVILNDITNFLRIGDITCIDEHGNIEFVEVKRSRKRRGSRVTRQKERMTEVVEFFNTSVTDLDGKKLAVLESSVRQKNYLPLLLDGIKKARNKGYESILIGDYLILQIVDHSKEVSLNEVVNYFKGKHRRIQEKWKKQDDLVLSNFFTDKLDYAKNYAPFTVYPFDVDICADILMGKLAILARFNFSEFMRMFEKAGWKVVDSIVFRTETELENVPETADRDLSLLKMKKGDMTAEFPPGWLGRLIFEVLSPKVFIEHYEEELKKGPSSGYDMHAVNFLDEANIWI